MTTTAVDKAKMFLLYVASREADLAVSCVDPHRYREHDPRVADGVVGLKEHVARIPAQSRFQVARAFEDGDLVVVQGEGGTPDREVSFHVFRFANGLIVEHWAFSAPAAPVNASGHTQTDGPAAPRPDHDTETTKSFVKTYYQRVHLGGEHDLIPQYVAAGCIRHEPGATDGRDAFMSDLKVLIQGRSIDEIRLFMGKGDLVFLAAMGTAHGKPCVYVDLYRVDADQIVERWGFPQVIPPRSERGNDYGML